MGHEGARPSFWALRGGGNFGVVTAMEFDLYPVPTLYGGNLVYDGTLARTALRFYRDWIAMLPDELSSWLAIMKFSPSSHVPEAFRGKTLVLVIGAFMGSAVRGTSVDPALARVVLAGRQHIPSCNR